MIALCENNLSVCMSLNFLYAYINAYALRKQRNVNVRTAPSCGGPTL